MFGGIEKIPQDALNACAGRNREEAILAATSGKRVGSTDIKFVPPIEGGPPPKPEQSLEQKVDKLQKTIVKLSSKEKEVKPPPPPPKGGTKTKTKLVFKHQDPKVVQSVTSRFGTSGFREMKALVDKSLGKGKWDLVAASKYFKNGKFHGDVARARDSSHLN
jgi:hypothetical protein